MIQKKLTDFGGKAGGEACAGGSSATAANAAANAAANSAAFSAAFHALREAGGGELRVGRGVWPTGPIELYSHTTLILDEGALIQFVPEPSLYPPVRTRWEGIECYAMKPLVYAKGRRDITIQGAGVFDGGGAVWWEALREKQRRGRRGPETALELQFAALNPGWQTQPSGGGARELQFLRPPLMQFCECASVRLEGFTLRNSPFWTLHPLYCRDVTIRGLTITNPEDAPNTDGIDIDSCEDTLVENCRLSVGDDAIVIKSGSGADGIRVGRPSRNIRVDGCEARAGHGGIVIGSETAAGIFNVEARNCAFYGTDRGIRVKTRRGRGGEISGLSFRDITIENSLCPFTVNMFYRCGADVPAADGGLADGGGLAGAPGGLFSQAALPVDGGTPRIHDIHLENIRATGCRASAGLVCGLPEQPVKGLLLRGCEFSTNEDAPDPPSVSDMYLGLDEVSVKSFRLVNVERPVLENVRITGPQEPFIFR